jgi:hypothetical protein
MATTKIFQPRLETLADVARFMQESFPEARNFPDREQPLSQQKRDLRLDRPSPGDESPGSSSSAP